jgi:two-component system, NarL family, sensor histidine kinase UhpB
VNGTRENGLTGGRRHWNTWGQYVAVAAAYEAVYEIIYYLSFQQFLLTTGLRLACMLLLPPRYWLALAVGESVPLIENAVFCIDNFGTPWAILASIPTVAVWWPLLLRVRRRWGLYDTDGRLRIPVIVGATLGTAVITSAITTATLVAALLHAPGKWPNLSPETFFFGYLLGAYLGALTLTPVVLALKERFRALSPQSLSIATVWRSPLLRDTLGWVAPALAVLAWFALTTPDDGLRQWARFALLWPVIGLAWRYAWHGAAVGGMGASFALALTAKGPLDADTLQVQIVLALVLSATLWVTARVPAHSPSIRAQHSQQ